MLESELLTSGMFENSDISLDIYQSESGETVYLFCDKIGFLFETIFPQKALEFIHANRLYKN